MKQKNEIEYAVVQSGYAVFGLGNTEEAALEDAAKWMGDADGVQGGLSASEVSDLLKPRRHHLDGDFILIDSDDPEFEYYVNN